MNTGNRIKKLREQLGMSLTDLGAAVGTTKQTIYKYENSVVTNIPLDRLNRMANVLNTTTAYLCGWTEDSYNYDLDPDSRFSVIPSAWVDAWREDGLTAREMWDRYQMLENDHHMTSDHADRPSNILPIPKMKNVPLLGNIACGEPILAEENIEGFLAMPETVGADFCLRCKGDSMINARIFDGDIVYVRQQETVENGEIAAVMVGDDEATLKRVHLFPDHVVLEPENPQYRAKSFWDADMAQVRILGKAVAFVSTVM